MAKRNFAQRGMTDYEKYMVTLRDKEDKKQLKVLRLFSFQKVINVV